MITINNKPINITMFPDKTSQVWKLSTDQLLSHEIDWMFESESEIIHLAQAKDLLSGNVRLNIHYLPYARQDHEIVNYNCFALHSFSKLLNILNFSSIEIHDPHSKKALEFINNSYPVYNFDLINKLLLDVDLVCYPDRGAKEKYKELIDFASFYGDKIRNPLTGEIEKYDLSIISEIKGKRILIIDDICDGGATFIKLTEELKKNQVNNIYLYVSHGLFTHPEKHVILKKAGINRIFTKDGEVL